MKYENCQFLKIEVWFVPPCGTGVNSIWNPRPDGSVLLMYKYHEKGIGDWPARCLN